MGWTDGHLEFDPSHHPEAESKVTQAPLSNFPPHLKMYLRAYTSFAKISCFSHEMHHSSDITDLTAMYYTYNGKLLTTH